MRLKMTSNGVDSRSIGMCLLSIILDINAQVTMSEASTILAAIAALTTITYNAVRIWRETKK
jgi:hypothetical protein